MNETLEESKLEASIHQEERSGDQEKMFCSSP